MNRKIDRENYEHYFAAYLDGELPDSGKAELKAFLLRYPELEEQLEALNAARLIPSPIPFEKKEVLREYASDTQAPRLRPDTSIRFEKKKQLYRKRPFILRIAVPLAAGISGVAAIGLLFLTTGLLSGRPESHPASPQLLSAGVERLLPIQPAQALEPGLPLPGRLPTALSHRKTPVRRIDPPMEISANIHVTLQEEQAELLALVPVSPRYEQELVLNETAKEWISSAGEFHSRNLFSSVIDTGKQLAGRSKTSPE